jgi:hypothetical protein
VAYQFLSGRLPYEAQSLTELALKQQREVPPPLHHLDPSIPPGLGVAVERALALDPRARYASAEEMRIALLEGAAGRGPDTDVTRMSQTGTSATTVLPGEPGTGPVVVPREPRAPRRAAPAPPAAAPAPARRSGRAAPAQRRQHRLRRALGLLLLLALLAAGGAAAYVATSNDNNSVQLRKVVYDDANRIIDELTQLIDDNTQ